jgi:septal ring factor EnvC (AmiA/AmiB activator)
MHLQELEAQLRLEIRSEFQAKDEQLSLMKEQLAQMRSAIDSLTMQVEEIRSRLPHVERDARTIERSVATSHKEKPRGRFDESVSERIGDDAIVIMRRR